MIDINALLDLARSMDFDEPDAVAAECYLRILGDQQVKSSLERYANDRGLIREMLDCENERMRRRNEWLTQCSADSSRLPRPIGEWSAEWSETAQHGFSLVLSQVLAELTAEETELFRLCYVLNQTSENIAQQTGHTPSAVRREIDDLTRKIDRLFFATTMQASSRFLSAFIPAEDRFDSPAADESGWSDEKNERRSALIDKRIQGVTDRAEQIELFLLTQEMRRHIDGVAPIDLDPARNLHATLLEKQRKQGAES